MEIAIIAHDGKKADMVQFLNKNKTILQRDKIKQKMQVLK
jgi:methylglyoxal synthase